LQVFWIFLMLTISRHHTRVAGILNAVQANYDGHCWWGTRNSVVAPSLAPGEAELVSNWLCMLNTVKSCCWLHAVELVRRLVLASHTCPSCPLLVAFRSVFGWRFCGQCGVVWALPTSLICFLCVLRCRSNIASTHVPMTRFGVQVFMHTLALVKSFNILLADINGHSTRIFVHADSNGRMLR
jgi:hypothetical protein